MAKIVKENIPFTQVANIVLNDEKLSWKAKGLFAYLFSKPDNWQFSGDRIAKDSSDGRKATYSGIKELEDMGYIARKRLGDGKVIYDLKFSVPNARNGQEDIEPLDRKGKEPKGKRAERGSISNIVLINNKDIINNKDDKISRFFENDGNNSEIIEYLTSRGLDEGLVRSEMTKFVAYWTEPSKSGKRVRWEGEKYFDLKRRLATWFSNAIKYNKKPIRQSGFVLK